MRRAALVALLAVAACSRGSEEATEPTAGRALEAAALNAGLVSDTGDAGGVYAAGDDRVCLSETARRRFRIGVSVDYGEGQRCIAHGIASGGEALDIDLGNGCRFRATPDGERLAFPVPVPDACTALCQGRATLDGLAVERLSAAPGEAARLRGADGNLLCAD